MNKIEIDLSTQNFKIFFTSDLHFCHENIIKFWLNFMNPFFNVIEAGVSVTLPDGTLLPMPSKR